MKPFWAWVVKLYKQVIIITVEENFEFMIGIVMWISVSINNMID